MLQRYAEHFARRFDLSADGRDALLTLLRQVTAQASGAARYEDVGLLGEG